MSLVAFRQDLALRGRGTCAQESYTKQVKAFLAWSGGDLPQDLRPYLASLRERHLKTASIVAIFTALNAYYDFLVEAGQAESNPVPAFKKRYLHQYKAGSDSDQRRCITVEEAARIVSTALDSRKQAIIMLLAKTGMRIHELTALDVGDIDTEKKEIILKPTPKRSNRTLFYDDETARVLARWLAVRESQGYPRDAGALITAAKYTRLHPHGAGDIIRECSRLAGVGDPAIGKDHITPHYFRVFFTTQLLRAGMLRHYVQELRGDSGGAAIDVYTRIDREELRRAYLAHIPQLGV